MKHVDRLPGGLADSREPREFSRRALKKGRKVELEHTSRGDLATEIAMDHLTEDPSYYDKLEKMEKSASLVRFRAFADELIKIAGNQDTITSKDRAAFKARFPDAGCSLGKDSKGYFVYTHRARSKSYPSVTALPPTRVDFVSSTS